MLVVTLFFLGLSIILSGVAASVWVVWPGDLTLLTSFQGTLNGFTEPFFNIFNSIGDTRGRIVFCASAIVWFFYINRIRQLGFIISIVLVAAGIAQLLKVVVDRPRPELPEGLQAFGEVTSSSFPSGHVTFAVAYFGAIFVLVLGSRRIAGFRKLILLCLLSILPLLVGVSRITWGVHWPSDTLGGFLTGCFAILLVNKIYLMRYGRA